MSSTHCQFIQAQREHGGALMLAKWRTMHPMPTTRIMRMVWKRSSARLTPSSRRLNRWSTHWAPRATQHALVKTCNSATLTSLMVGIHTHTHTCYPILFESWIVANPNLNAWNMEIIEKFYWWTVLVMTHEEERRCNKEEVMVCVKINNGCTTLSIIKTVLLCSYRIFAFLVSALVNVNNNVKITRIYMWWPLFFVFVFFLKGSTGLIQIRVAHEILSRFTAILRLEERAVSSQIKRVKGWVFTWTML